MDTKKITFVCMKWSPNAPKNSELFRSKSYSSKNVNELFLSLKRKVSESIDFVCVTDDSSELHPEIRVLDFSGKFDGLPGQYKKLDIFSPQLHNSCQDFIIYMDLDVAIIGDFVSSLPDELEFCVFAPNNRRIAGIKFLGSGGVIGYWVRRLCPSKKIEKFFLDRNQPINSSVIGVRNGILSRLYSDFNYDDWAQERARYAKSGYKGTDQLYISSQLNSIDGWFPLGPKEGIYKPRVKDMKKMRIRTGATVLVLAGVKMRSVGYQV